MGNEQMFKSSQCCPVHHVLFSFKLIVPPCFYVVGFDENIESQGELILQESFQVWDPKTLIRKGRERHLFLFEMSLVFSKEVKDSSGRSKYLYKSKLFVSIDVQNCKFKGNTLAVFLQVEKNYYCFQCNLPNCPKMWSSGIKKVFILRSKYLWRSRVH